MRMLASLLMALVLVGCAQTDFKMLETRSPLIYDGRGGTKQVVDGMDFWDSGEPPRRFFVIGYVDDVRREGHALMAMLKIDVVRKAREGGGDAVVQVGGNSRLIGMSTLNVESVSSSGTFNRRGWSSGLFGVGTGTTQEVRERSTKYAVIKYVDSGIATVSQPDGSPVQVMPGPIAPSMLYPNARGAVPAVMSGIEQPGREVRGLPVPDQSGPDKWAAQEYAKRMGCHTMPIAVLAMRTPGIETYAVGCSNGAQIMLQCQYGNCRAMQ